MATNNNSHTVESRTNTLHVLCIGGSGLRVLRSLIMLFSSGYDIPGYIVRPYIIDPHLQSEDLKFVTELIAKYQELQSNDNKGFLKVPLSIDNMNNLNVMKVDNTQQQSFGDFIGYKKFAHQSNEQYIVDMLYSGLNLDKSMNVGFKGSPNVGSVVFQEFINGEWFQKNFSNLTSNDKIILIGSLFGGTGASGIPAIAKELKSKSKQTKISAITLTPYFKLKKPDQKMVDKDIDSDIFNIKSLAALNYYNQNNPGIDNFYVIGDSMSEDYEYDEVKQGNKAHFIELVSATAIKHFAITDDENNNRWNMFFTNELQPTMLYDDCGDGLNDVIFCLANFYAFCKFFTLMKKERFYPFYRLFYKEILDNQDNSDKIKLLEDLIYNSENTDSYIRWLGELRDNTRSFNVINTSDIKSPYGQISYYSFEPQTNNPVFNGTEKFIKRNMSDYFLSINNCYRKSLRTTDQMNKVAKLLNISYSGIIEVNS